MNKEEYLANIESEAYGSISVPLTFLFVFFIFSLIVVALIKTDNRNHKLESIIQTHEQFYNISENHKLLNTYISICTQNYLKTYILDDDFYFSCVQESLTKFTQQNKNKEFHTKTINDFHDIVLKKRKSIMAD